MAQRLSVRSVVQRAALVSLASFIVMPAGMESCHWRSGIKHSRKVYALSLKKHYPLIAPSASKMQAKC